jgi:hypothetical protein
VLECAAYLALVALLGTEFGGLDVAVGAVVDERLGQVLCEIVLVDEEGLAGPSEFRNTGAYAVLAKFCAHRVYSSCDKVCVEIDQLCSLP